MKPSDEAFMRRALRLAARGQGYVEPNPMVGCVLVRSGRVLGEGWHRRFGGPHAEAEALRSCEGAARGATAYVTLEPCNHFGKTPPCADALIAAGITRVVAALRDPNPLVAGRGFRRLRAAGVAVTVGLLAEEAAALNAPFVKLMTQRRPWVILKWAQSLDGRIATHTGDSKWITGQQARAHAHRTRGRVDAVLVGAGTVLADDPLLTCRAAKPRRVATRVVLDSRLRTPSAARLVRTARATPTWLICTKAATARRQRALEAAGCTVVGLPAGPGGVVSLPALLDLLGEREMTNVLVEGGGALLGSFMDQGLADEVHAYIAALLIGGSAAVPALGGKGAARVAAACRLDDAQLAKLDEGWFLRGRPRRRSERDAPASVVPRK